MTENGEGSRTPGRRDRGGFREFSWIKADSFLKGKMPC